MMSDDRVVRDFTLRSKEDREELLLHTWCDHCQKVDLGMSDPLEYELHGIIFLEGKCQMCGEVVLTEITDDEF